jgi:hypothetical protein
MPSCCYSGFLYAVLLLFRPVVTSVDTRLQSAAQLKGVCSFLLTINCPLNFPRSSDSSSCNKTKGYHKPPFLLRASVMFDYVQNSSRCCSVILRCEVDPSQGPEVMGHAPSGVRGGGRGGLKTFLAKGDVI